MSDVRTKCCHSPCCEGSCPSVPVTKDLIHSVRHANSEYALFFENQHKQALLEEEEKKKKEEAVEAKRVEQRTSKRLHEQLAEQVQLEMVQMAEKETARQLIAEASQKLFAAIQGTANKGCTGCAKCGQQEALCHY